MSNFLDDSLKGSAAVLLLLQLLFISYAEVQAPQRDIIVSRVTGWESLLCVIGSHRHLRLKDDGSANVQ